ncbi:MAG: phosphatase PAP2 family protein [Gammaproteobacteria bacterium]|nr:phosphatase PAP2 family protein [Gammaproteobacteria bacterium]
MLAIMRVQSFAVVLLALLAAAPPARAGIDHMVPYDSSGIWKRSNQEIVEYGLIAASVGGALWEGGESRLGRTFWTSVDSSVAAGLVSQLMKVAFSRVRPRDSGPPPGNPNLWFKGNGNESFPSGEVTAVSSIVTPFMLEYGHDHPGVYALALLPVYDSIARVKAQAHWQTDVLAGFALGSGTAWLIHRSPNSPFILQIMPHSIYVGIGKRF